MRLVEPRLPRPRTKTSHHLLEWSFLAESGCCRAAARPGETGVRPPSQWLEGRARRERIRRRQARFRTDAAGARMQRAYTGAPASSLQPADGERLRRHLVEGVADNAEPLRGASPGRPARLWRARWSRAAITLAPKISPDRERARRLVDEEPSSSRFGTLPGSSSRSVDSRSGLRPRTSVPSTSYPSAGLRRRPRPARERRGGTRCPYVGRFVRSASWRQTATSRGTSCRRGLTVHILRNAAQEPAVLPAPGPSRTAGRRAGM